MKIRNAVSLFHGMGCFNIAAERSGLEFDNCYTSEIDKYATIVDKANNPKNICMGDVTKWREWNIDWSSIDLLVGGSPCQGFSGAGKQGGTKAIFNGETIIVSDRETYIYMKENGAEFLSESYLFWEYVLCLDHAKKQNPNLKFMLENVKMTKPNLNMLTEALGVQPVFINSALLSAQNRQRWYWANWEFGEPVDLGITFKSVLVGNPEYHTKLTETCVNKFKRYNVKFMNPEVPKGKVLTAGDYVKLGKYGNYLEDATPANKDYYPAVARKGSPRPVVLTGEKFACLTSTYFKGIRADGRPALATDNGEFDPMWKSGDIRKLTPVECERLQTVPDNYTNHVSNTQRYKMLGNGWTIDVIAHIFSSMIEAKKGKTNIGESYDMF